MALAQNAHADTALIAEIVMDLKEKKQKFMPREPKAESNGLAQEGRT